MYTAFDFPLSLYFSPNTIQIRRLRSQRARPLALVLIRDLAREGGLRFPLLTKEGARGWSDRPFRAALKAYLNGIDFIPLPFRKSKGCFLRVDRIPA